MSYTTIRRDIERRLEDNWATTRIAFENLALKPEPAPNEEWIEMRIFEDVTQRITIGNPGVHRSTGLLAINIYVPVNTGTQTGRSYGDTLAALFRDKQFGGITFREVRVRNAGQNGGWYMFNMTSEFYWDGVY